MNAFCFLLLFLLPHCRRVYGNSGIPDRISRIEPVIDSAFSIHTPDNTNDLFHTDTFTLYFTAFNTSFSLHLTPNLDLFHPEATTRIFSADDENDDDILETLYPHDFRIYKGYVLSGHGRVDLSSWARITIPEMVEQDERHVIFEGAFKTDSDIYHIKTTPNFRLSRRDDDPDITGRHHTAGMVIYRDSDSLPRYLLDKRDKHDDIVCAMEEMEFNQLLSGIRHNTTTNSETAASTLSRRSTIAATTPQGCPTTRKIAYMGVVADCTYVRSYGSIRLARLQIINDWNIASGVYERSFNVSLGLIYIQMSSADCPRHPKQQTNWNQECSQFYTINDRLSDFSLWRGKRGEDGAALWHLMTKCSTGVKVGIAWLSQLCETQVSQQIEDTGASEWVSGTGVSSITRDEWKVVAHEIGHGFGAIHDCTAQTCPCTYGCSCCPLSDITCSAGDTYLMNPTSNVTTEDFSPCAIADICSSFPNIGYCLKAPDMRDTSSYTLCGNGILEPGEECDSGQTDSACCLAKNCTLKAGAVCDDYSQQCCLNCTTAPATTVCRPAVSECDTAEYCTGDSFSCPADAYEENGSVCANGTMHCASGVCTSRDEQCITRGMRLGITEDCPFQEDACQISCADPSNPGNCLVLSGVFLDGTECGLASFCEKGICVSTGALNKLKAWVSQNKKIAIPVILFGSLIVLGVLGWLGWFIMARYRRNQLAVAKDKDSRPPSFAHTDDDNNSAIIVIDNVNYRGNRDSITTATRPRPRTGSLGTIGLAAATTGSASATVIASAGTSAAERVDEDEAWELRPISTSTHNSSAIRSSLHRYNQSEGSFYLPTTTTRTTSATDSSGGESGVGVGTVTASGDRYTTQRSNYLPDASDSVALALRTGGQRHRRVKSTTT